MGFFLRRLPFLKQAQLTPTNRSSYGFFKAIKCKLKLFVTWHAQVFPRLPRVYVFSRLARMQVFPRLKLVQPFFRAFPKRTFSRACHWRTARFPVLVTGARFPALVTGAGFSALGTVHCVMVLAVDVTRQLPLILILFDGSHYKPL